MKRSNVQYRPLNSQGRDHNGEDSSSSDEFESDARLLSSSNVANDDQESDFVDYKGHQTWDNDDGVKFQSSNFRKKKKFQHWIPEQFMLPKRDVPWKSIMYAVALFVMGTVLLVCGCLIHVGKVDNDRYGDRLWPLIIFGLLMFIPGSYHVYLVVNVFLGKPGYTFDDFPQFED